MTQRSIQAGPTPVVVVKASGDIQVEGWKDERVTATSDNRWGLQVERRRASEIGRVRARVGERVLFDVHVNAIGRKKEQAPAELIEVKIGGSGTVHVPLGSTVKLYAGRGATASDLHGSVTVYAGRNVQLRRVHSLVHVSAGRALDVECETLAGETDVKLSAGRDLRFYVRDLTDARVIVNDIGGDWEGVIGRGTRRIRLKAGGDVTIVTRQQVEALPPDYILGNIEAPKETGDDESRKKRGGET